MLQLPIRQGRRQKKSFRNKTCGCTRFPAHLPLPFTPSGYLHSSFFHFIPFSSRTGIQTGLKQESENMPKSICSCPHSASMSETRFRPF